MIMAEVKIKLGKETVGLEEKLTPEKEEYVYGYLIEVLTGGLYPNKFDVIREYVQNSFDAVIEWQNGQGVNEEDPISIDIDKPVSITIFDKGTGMDLENIKKYRYIGYSEKKMGSTVGYQGIGKLAGITAANKLIVTTSPYGLPEKYRLEFDAKNMLESVKGFREERKNITIKELISKYTDITTETEDEKAHYTFIELHEIKSDCDELFKEEKLTDYLANTVSLPFNPDFKYAEQIEENLKTFVHDYEWVDIKVNGKKIFKPYRNDIKPPGFLPVYDEKNRQIAHLWYCQNKVGSQLAPREKAGIIYRCKNFRIGDNFLPRNTIWKNSDHLAFHFTGEIHICDSNILPTASRDDFKHSKSRDSLYRNAVIISTTLNKLARTESKERKAYDYIKNGNSLVEKIQKEIEEKKIPTELMEDKFSELIVAKKNIMKRIDDLPSNDRIARKNAILVAGKLNEIANIVKIPENGSKHQKTYDITDKLSLSTESSKVYNVTISVLKDFFIDDPESFERILKKIHSKLEREFKND